MNCLGKAISILADQQKTEVIGLIPYDMQENKTRNASLKPKGGMPRQLTHQADTKFIKAKFFSQALGNHQLGHQALQLGGHQPGYLASRVAPGAEEGSMNAFNKWNASPTPSRQFLEPSSWENTQTFFMQMRDRASSSAGCIGKMSNLLFPSRKEIWKESSSACGPSDGLHGEQVFSVIQITVYSTSWEARQPRNTQSGWWNCQDLLQKGDE